MSTNYQITQLDSANGLAYYTETDQGVKYEYYCIPKFTELLVTELGWKVLRMRTDSTTGDFVAGKAIERAGGSPDFTWAATDLAYVKALSYV